MRMTMWEANAAGYKPFVEWYRHSEHPVKDRGYMTDNHFFHYWLDVWKTGPYGVGELAIVDISDARPHIDEPYWWDQEPKSS